MRIVLERAEGRTKHAFRELVHLVCVFAALQAFPPGAVAAAAMIELEYGNDDCHDVADSIVNAGEAARSAVDAFATAVGYEPARTPTRGDDQ